MGTRGSGVGAASDARAVPACADDREHASPSTTSAAVWVALGVRTWDGGARVSGAPVTPLGSGGAAVRAAGAFRRPVGDPRRGASGGLQISSVARWSLVGQQPFRLFRCRKGHPGKVAGQDQADVHITASSSLRPRPQA